MNEEKIVIAPRRDLCEISIGVEGLIHNIDDDDLYQLYTDFDVIHVIASSGPSMGRCWQSAAILTTGVVCARTVLATPTGPRDVSGQRGG